MSRERVIYASADDRRTGCDDRHGRMRTSRRRLLYPEDVRPTTGAKVRQRGEKRTLEAGGTVIAVTIPAMHQLGADPTHRRFVKPPIDQCDAVNYATLGGSRVLLLRGRLINFVFLFSRRVIISASCIAIAYKKPSCYYDSRSYWVRRTV